MLLIRLNFLIGLLFFASATIMLSLFEGTISISHFFSIFRGHADPLAKTIFFDIRLPRTLCAFTTGGLLALAGALMQTLLRNPLADPYVLGTSGGAAISSLICLLYGLTGIALSFGAWIGSLLSILLVFVFAEKNKSWNTEHLILIGIALASGFSAVISLILLRSPDHILRGMLFWLVGDVSETSVPHFEMIFLIISVFISLSFAKELNILIRGEKEALALGVNVRALKIKLFLLSSALTAVAVTLCGCIGFIGLIVPHLFRLAQGYDHRFLLPGCVLLGGSVLTLADTLSRVLFAPEQIPVGIIMTLIGIPAFLILLQKKL